MFKQIVSKSWILLIQTILLFVSIVIILFHNTVLKLHISCIINTIWNKLTQTFKKQQDCTIEEVKNYSNEISRDEMALFALKYGGVISRVVANPLFKTFYTRSGEVKVQTKNHTCVTHWSIIKHIFSN